MAHFAKLDANNVVQTIMVVDNMILIDENGNESEAKGIEYCKSLIDGNWVQASYNEKFRKRYPAPGFIYSPEHDVFMPPKPNPNFIVDPKTLKWIPPVPRPEDTTQPYRYMDLARVWMAIPKPYPSWSFLNDGIERWSAPVPMPMDGKKYIWDESVLNWVEDNS